ncbi:Vitamin B12 transporter BtuB [Arenibacter antarcticus]|uniref:TonB-dependent receptor domain-containing protein n=1 Tax=Arenibacter antarcticus TaxID=2040469 RepID=A0ABW5VGG6_9FLAO|nr:TonB-dependent receptor [Arenibacter sp. H213]MCM4166204.1 TonB-dependent receptor [Arenibacter sp. H213]
MKNILLSLLSSMAVFTTYSQNTLSGRITDRSTNEPLEQVSVYFPDLEKGTITNENGSFTIGKLPPGIYKVVASYIGFQSFTQNITLQQGKNRLNIALSPSAIEMEEVIVSTPFHKLQRDNVMKVEFAKIATLKSKGPPTLIEGIGKIPGVGVVSTGVGIGKPVIRGLTSNRVLVYTQGIRLENQQFGAEHGLGVNEAGIESVEVIKGPASLLYGSDAMGGVLYLNPEKFLTPNSTEGDVNLSYNSNTQGITSNVGVRSSGEKLRFLARAATNNHIDYTGGDGNKVTNSRFNEKDLKMGVSYQNTIFKSEIRYNYNQSNLGIPETIGTQTTSRTPELPYQKINNHILSSKSKIFFENTSLDLTLGYIGNFRKEFEDHHHDENETDPDNGEEEHSEAALDMKLNTFNYNILYLLPKWGKSETIVGIQGIHQTNANFGEEILIPDATTNDVGVLGTTHFHLNENNDFQFGLRYDYRKIAGKAYGILGEEGYIADLDRDFSSFNGAFGYKNNISKQITARINVATGFRAPNLAELTSYGGHSGANRFEIGNADLKNEQNIQVDLALEFQNEHVELFLNGFHNSIKNYIFIAPDGTFINQNAVYNYLQQDATLYGGEVGFHLHPHPYDWLHIESSYQTVFGKLNHGNPLPLIPANNLTNTLRVAFFNANSWWLRTNAFISLNTTFKQGKIGEFETVTPEYSILDAGFGGELKFMKRSMNINISANNILNKKYIAHLSRLKSDGILNIGRSVTLGVTILL